MLDFQAKLYCTFGCLHISPSNFMNVNFIILSLSITFNKMLPKSKIVRSIFVSYVKGAWRLKPEKERSDKCVNACTAVLLIHIKTVSGWLSFLSFFSIKLN